MIQKVALHKGFHYQIQQTTHKGHASQIAKHQIGKGFKAIVAIGGDGTINEVARSLIQTDEVLGIVPCGSGNGLARHLGISLTPMDALMSLSEARPVRIDTGLINQHPFLCTAGIGLEGEVTRRFNQIDGRGLGNYIKTSFETFFGFKSFVNLEHPDVPLLNITIANASQWGNEVHIAPKASLVDQRLDLGVFKKFAKIWTPLVVLRLLFKSVESSRYFDAHGLTYLKAHFDRTLPMQADGEYMGQYDTIHLEVVPKSLTVLSVKARI